MELYFLISLKEDRKRDLQPSLSMIAPIKPQPAIDRRQRVSYAWFRVCRGEYRPDRSIKVDYATWNPEMVTGRPAYQVSLFPLSPRRSVGVLLARCHAREGFHAIARFLNLATDAFGSAAIPFSLWHRAMRFGRLNSPDSELCHIGAAPVLIFAAFDRSLGFALASSIGHSSPW